MPLRLKVRKGIIPNSYLATISNTYECIGRIRDEEVKPIWEKLKKEWNEE